MFAATTLWAGDITVTFQFDKRPAKAVLVYMLDDDSLKLKEAPVVDQVNREFTNPVVIAPKDTTIKLKNSDDVEHNIYAQDIKNDVAFDIGLAPPGSEVDKVIDWNEGLVIKIGCKIHPKMRSWIANIDSKYHGIHIPEKTEKTFEVKLDAVPGDKKMVRIWMPGYDDIRIEVGAGANQEGQLSRKGKPKGTYKVSRS